MGCHKRLSQLTNFILWDVYFHLKMTKKKRKKKVGKQSSFSGLKGTIERLVERGETLFIFMISFCMQQLLNVRWIVFLEEIFLTDTSLGGLHLFCIFHWINEICFPFQKKKEKVLTVDIICMV